MFALAAANAPLPELPSPIEVINPLVDDQGFTLVTKRKSGRLSAKTAKKPFL